MEAALVRFPNHGAEITEYFSLPKYGENFNIEDGIVHPDLKEEFISKVNTTC